MVDKVQSIYYSKRGALLGKESDLSASEASVLNENLTADKKKIKARERNSLAMAYLLTAFKSAADVSLA